jgi:ComF family protein
MFEAPPALVNLRPGHSALLGHFLTRVLRHGERVAWRLLVPGVCALCGGGGIQWRRCRGGLDLCVPCEAALPFVVPAPASAQVGGLPLHAVCDFQPPADFMVRQLKFGGERSFARVLGLLLAETRLRAGGLLPVALVPVPLHLQRLRERGYNQAAELARFAARRLRLPVWARALERHRATVAQSGLPAAARGANVQGCFTARPLPPGCRVALVDDVFTTGSTAQEAARCLREAGAAEVEVWVACRAGRQQRPRS